MGNFLTVVYGDIRFNLLHIYETFLLFFRFDIILKAITTGNITLPVILFTIILSSAWIYFIYNLNKMLFEAPAGVQVGEKIKFGKHTGTIISVYNLRDRKVKK